MNLARLTTLPELAALKSAGGSQLFPESTVRGWMERDYLRFRSRCVVRVGGRTMVDLDEVERWLEDQRGGRVERDTPGEPIPIRCHRRVAPDFADVRREVGVERAGRRRGASAR